MNEKTSRVVVAALYRFARFPEFASFKQPLLDTLLASGVRGTLLLAAEGINGTIAGDRAGIDSVLDFLQQDPRFASLEVKESFVDESPFYRTKVKLKKEIVTMGVSGIDPNQIVGTYVEAPDWNDLISDPGVLLLDTRNKYEVEIGSFAGAINPGTASFREFPDYVKNQLDPSKHKKVAMFCTGGIRCEKSTAYLRDHGFEEVYHLKGGILKYLEEVPESESKWRGECFVFDNRVTVNHKLERGSYDQCHACRMPITEQDKLSEGYQPGVSCHYCVDKHSPEQLERYAERERQIELAQRRGEEHLGQHVQATIERRREQKLGLKQSQRDIEQEKA